MINTIFYFVDDETFDYNAALLQEAISPYTIVFNKFDKTIKMGGVSYGQMNRADITSVLSNMSDILPVATDMAIGGIKLGYVAAANADVRTYAVQLDENNRAFVSVPWTDTVSPQYDDTALRTLISEQSTRIDGYILNLNTAIKERTEQLLGDAQWVEDNLTEGLFGGQSTDTTEELLKTYGVWNWKDPNDHSQGKDYNITKLQASVLGLQGSVGNLSDNMAVLGTLEIKVDGEYTLTTEAAGTDTSGAIEISTISEEIAGLASVANGDTFRTSQFDTLPASNTIYKKGSTYFHFVKSDGVIDSVTNLTNSINQYGPNFDKLVKMAASTLGLKTSQNGTLLTTMSDLASVITTTPNQTTGSYFTGYSGLNTKVEELSDGMSAHSSLLSTITKSTDPDDPNYGKLSDDLMTGIINDVNVSGAISTAQTNLISSINNKTAGITVMVTKDSSTGVVDSGITLKADQVTIDANQTNFKSAVASFVKTDVLQAGNATFSGHLSGVDGTFTGTLSGATGQFSGDVTATKFLAGNPNGLNISMTDKAITFNVGGEARAWFTPFNANGTSSDGMYLYIMNPDQSGSNKIIEINFSSGMFEDATATAPVPTHVARFYRISGSSVQVVERYYKTVGNVTTYYSDVECEHPATDSLNLYEYSSVEYNDKSYDYCIVNDTSESNNVYRFVNFERYRSISISNGALTEGNTYKYFLLDSMYNNKGRLFLGNASQQTITTPNTNVMMAWSGMQMGDNGETGYTIESDATITPYCPQIANSYTSLSGTITLYRDYAGGTDNLYLGSYDYTIL